MIYLLIIFNLHFSLSTYSNSSKFSINDKFFINEVIYPKNNFIKQLIIETNKPMEYTSGDFSFYYDNEYLSSLDLNCDLGLKENSLGYDWNVENCRWYSDKNIKYNDIDLEDLNIIFDNLMDISIDEIKNNCDNGLLVESFKNFFSNITTPMFVFAFLFLFFAGKKFYLYTIFLKKSTKTMIILYSDNFNDNNSFIEEPSHVICCRKFYYNGILNTMIQSPFITLFFSRYFFLIGETKENIQMIYLINERYNVFEQPFMISRGNFFSYYLYTIIGILGTIPLTITSLVLNIDRLNQDYDFDTLVLILMTFTNFIFTVITPCFLKTFDESPIIVLIDFWWALVRFGFFTLFRFIY